MRYHAFNAGSANSVVGLAMSILQADQKNHDDAVDMALAVREAVLSLILAISLVTNFQSKENPIIAMSQDEVDSGEVAHNPAELLSALAEGYDGDMSTNFDTLLDEFGKHYLKMTTEAEVAKIPEDYGVSDILGEGSKETKED